MAAPEIKINRKKVDPGLSDLLQLFKKDIFLNMNCHALATVQSFDPDQQTVTATVNYKKVFSEKQPDNTYKNVLVDYPILMDAPVIIMGGGPWKLTFPIAAGDECLILFNDRDMDNWFASGQSLAPATQRLHSFSDGIALIGVNSLSNVLPEGIYDTTRTVIKNYTGGAMIGIGETLVKIANETTTLNTLLQLLIDQIKLITVTCAAPGNPSSVPNNVAAIAAVATQIQGLLE